MAKSILEILDEEGHTYWPESGLHKCYCMFHDDQKNPNMIIYSSTNSFHCFRCGAGHTAVDMLMKLKGISKAEATEIVHGKEYLKESLLGNKKDKKVSSFNLKLAISAAIRETLSKHSNDIVKLESLMKEIQKIDNIEPTVQNLDQILNQINRIGETCPKPKRI